MCSNYILYTLHIFWFTAACGSLRLLMNIALSTISCSQHRVHSESIESPSIFHILLCCSLKGRSHYTFHSIDFHSYAYKCQSLETQAHAKKFRISACSKVQVLLTVTFYFFHLNDKRSVIHCVAILFQV